VYIKSKLIGGRVCGIITGVICPSLTDITEEILLTTSKLLAFLRSRLIGPGAARLFAHREAMSGTNSWLIKIYHKLCCARILYRSGAMIPESAAFASRPKFPHGLIGVFVSQGAVIGKNCTVFQQVTIGSNTMKDSKKPGAPRIGDNVCIGAGAKIIGGVTVGDDVRIGANCVVAEDIPAGATVVMEKPRIIIRESARPNEYLSWDEYLSGS
jgi:serine O-acetyltransferase